MLELFTKYKALRRGCCFIKISSQDSSQECANCHRIHPDNRKTQATFACVNPDCGHTENADVNAARVLKQRAIKLIKQYPGAGLSEQGVLSPPNYDIGCGARFKTCGLNLEAAALRHQKRGVRKLVQSPKLAHLCASSSVCRAWRTALG
jgi:hypothetical protein